MRAITNCFASLYENTLEELPRKVTLRERKILFDVVGPPRTRRRSDADLR